MPEANQPSLPDSPGERARLVASLAARAADTGVHVCRPRSAASSAGTRS
jgi:hypothetical protein